MTEEKKRSYEKSLYLIDCKHKVMASILLPEQEAYYNNHFADNWKLYYNKIKTSGITEEDIAKYELEYFSWNYTINDTAENFSPEQKESYNKHFENKWQYYYTEIKKYLPEYTLPSFDFSRISTLK